MNENIKLKGIAILLIICSLTIIQLSAQGNGSLFTDDAKAKEIFYSGNMNEAVRHFNELLRVDSNHYEYNMLIAFAYLHSNIDKSKAIIHYQRALKNPKADPYIYFDMGKAYMLCYRFDEAVASFKTFISKGIKIDKTDLPPERYIEMCNNAQLLISLRNNVTIENVGNAINSAFPDYNACIDASETTLFYSSKQSQNYGVLMDIDGFKMADVYCSKWNGKQWVVGERLQVPINSGLVEDIVGISPDGNDMLLFFNNEKGYSDIFISHKEKKQFSRPELLSLTVNSDQIEQAASISPDGKWIFFSSNRAGGFGGFDIYYSRRLPNGEWSNPMNVGPNINTQYDDNFPYIAPDGTTFFSSSQGHNSMGGYDLFKSAWNEKEQFFAIPENLAFPINTPDDNKTISVTKSGRYAYIADFRDNSTGDLDIYKVTFLDIAAPYYILKGVITGTDSTLLMSNLQSYKVIIREAGSKKEIGTYRPNLHNGNFTFILQPGIYLLDYYIDDKLQYSLDYFIEDREPSQMERLIEFNER